MVKILTDTTSDISAAYAQAHAVAMVPLNILFDGEEYHVADDPDFQRFYALLRQADVLPTTSQPAPEAFIPYFESAKATGDSLVVILISGELSGTVQSANIAKAAVKYENIYIVDSLQTVTGLRLLVDEAIQLRDQGVEAQEIAAYLDAIKGRIKLMAIVDTLEYLYKGGRLSRISKIAGGILNFKPIITLRGTLSVIGKERGTSAAIQFVMNAIDIDNVDLSVPVYFGYTGERQLCEQLIQAAERAYTFPETRICPVGGVVGTHAGPNACVITYLEKER